MNKAGVAPDPKESNFLHDKEKGFGFLDYMPLEKRDKYTSAVDVIELKHMLTAGLQKDAKQVPHAENIQILNKFLDVLEEDYPDILKLAAERQDEIKADPNVGNAGIYDIYALPSGGEFDAFKARVLRLGLDGVPPFENAVIPESSNDDLVW
jgi:hypothetical protein